MKINPSQTGQTEAARAQESRASSKLTKTGETENAEASANGSAVGGAASTDISQRARDLAKAKQAAASAPDVREEKIRALKERIQKGEYNVKPDAIADKLVDEELAMRKR